MGIFRKLFSREAPMRELALLSPPDGFLPVLDMTGRNVFTKGFFVSGQYRFWRPGWNGDDVFCLHDQDPAFNLAGLWFKPPCEACSRI